MLGRRRLSRGSLVLVLVAAPILVTTKMRTRFVLLETTAAMMARAMTRMAIKRRRGGHVRSRRRVALVRGSVRRRRSRRPAIRIWSAHWSGCCLGLVAVKPHPNRRTHHLALGTTSIIVAATSTTSAATICSVGRRGLRLSTPLLCGGGVVRRRGWVRLAVGLLRSRLILRLTAVCRLRLIDLGSVVGVVVLGRKRSMRCTLRRVLSMVGLPGLLRRLRIAGLGRRAGVGCGILRAVGRLLAVAVAVAGVLLVLLMLLVVATAVGATATSATAMTAARGTVGRITARASARGCRRRSRRRGSVVV